MSFQYGRCICFPSFTWQYEIWDVFLKEMEELVRVKLGNITTTRRSQDFFLIGGLKERNAPAHMKGWLLLWLTGGAVLLIKFRNGWIRICSNTRLMKNLRTRLSVRTVHQQQPLQLMLRIEVENQGEGLAREGPPTTLTLRQVVSHQDLAVVFKFAVWNIAQYFYWIEIIFKSNADLNLGISTVCRGC